MYIESSEKNYWMHPNALSISLNALSLPNYVQVSLLSGSIIMAYVPSLIEFDASYNFRRWTLSAANTLFDTDTAKYVHARLSIEGTDALIVYADEKISVDGIPESQKDLIPVEGESTGESTEESSGSSGESTDIIVAAPDPDYYYLYLGTISQVIAHQRTWLDEFNPGQLNTDQNFLEESMAAFNKLFRHNTAKDSIDVLKDFQTFNVRDGQIGRAHV